MESRTNTLTYDKAFPNQPPRFGNSGSIDGSETEMKKESERKGVGLGLRFRRLFGDGISGGYL
jgi:hypothetical protein